MYTCDLVYTLFLFPIRRLWTALISLRKQSLASISSATLASVSSVILACIPLVTLASILQVTEPAFAERRVIQLSELGIRPGMAENYTPLFQKALDELKAKTLNSSDTLELQLAPGIYTFSTEGAREATYFISNHDQPQPRQIGIHLKGWKHFILNGKGSEFLFDARMLPIVIDGCQGVELRTLTIDFTNPQIAQLHILETDTLLGTTFTPAPWVQWRIDAEGRLVTYGKNWLSVPEFGLAFDPSSREIIYRTSDLSFPNKQIQEVRDSHLLKEGKGSTPILFAPEWRHPRLKAGMVFAARTGFRPQPALFVTDSRGVRLEAITVHYAEGMGLLAQNTEDIYLRYFNVMLRPSATSSRYFTTEADATHFVGCRGTVSVQHSRFENMMDDAMNVHGVYLKVVRREGNALVGRFTHPQAYGLDWASIGDSVRLVTTTDIQQLGAPLRVSNIEVVDRATDTGAKELKITFAERLPREISPRISLSLENLTRTPSVIFSDNLIRHNRARGILINTPRPVRITDNLFDHVSGAAILFSTDCNQWYESGGTQDVVIRGNIFQDVLTSLYQFTTAVISIHPVIPQLEKQKKPFYGRGVGSIRIEDNIFRTFDTPLLHAISVDGITWQRNRVEPTQSYPKYHPNQQPYRLEGCRNVTIDGKAY